MQKSVIDQLKRKQIAALLEQDKRIDGRGLEEQRKLVLETGVIPKANGSARVLLGNTHVVAGVKIQPDRPFPDTDIAVSRSCKSKVDQRDSPYGAHHKSRARKRSKYIEPLAITK